MSTRTDRWTTSIDGTTLMLPFRQITMPSNPAKGPALIRTPKKRVGLRANTARQTFFPGPRFLLAMLTMAVNTNE